MNALPPILWLQAFEAAARTLSFTRAGRELGVTQSAVSQRIRLLEDRLGQRLFVRHPRSLSLTPAGQAWLPSVQEAFGRLLEGTTEVFGSHPQASVTLRATPVMQQIWLAPRLLDFHRCHPGIVVHVVSAIWRDDFGIEGADIEIRYGLGDWEGVELQSLGSEAMLPVCAPRLAERLHAPADLVGETLLHAPGFAVGWSAWLEEAGVAGLDRHCLTLSCDSQIMTLALAARGGGVALIHQGLLNERDDLVAPFDLPAATDERFWLVRPMKQERRPEAVLLWEGLSP
ncbi:LysR family transcriptional regulator, glycine cleavage system transcriptional activator [Modicisalibacter ilicicola DSM 19980]|uniref:LysR family transcriptional regulator, glycine cleavage system transcriptional activator n=1 Tax=Modicisalibacter ilicicola DSM 19980 TaxID=1121942 RepID=A0A1M4TD03_9GAMM|nr:LysR family transcriptional regulator [Halomonas ilicicola]SHE42351.1 LysR family transcriptional regulator, glycine cleavage system transcriptional activator [Halomonas ilicicola DSM 19980]